MASGDLKARDFGIRLVLTSVSAVIAESATFPIDITKTRLQLQGEAAAAATGRGTQQQYRGALSTAAAIAREEGVISGLYRGLSPALLRHVFYTSIRIGSYEHMRNFLDKGENNLSVAQKALIGGASGIIGQVIASPADLIKVRMQADGRLVKLGKEARYRKGIADALYRIVSREGVIGLWRGVGPNAQRAFLVNMGELACYDQAKHQIIRNGFLADNVFAHTLASVLSGFCATVLSCPADVVKTRMMNQDQQQLGYRNSVDCLVKTVKREGFWALWKGFFPTWVRLGPWQFVFWVSYEQLRRLTGLSSF